MKVLITVLFIALIAAAVYDLAPKQPVATTTSCFVVGDNEKQLAIAIADERFEYFKEGIDENKPGERGFTKEAFAHSVVAMFSIQINELADNIKYKGRNFRIIIADNPFSSSNNPFQFVVDYFNDKMKARNKDLYKVFVSIEED